MRFNEIYNMDCLDGLRNIENESVDFCLISPPYDDLRTYKSDTSLHDVGMELFRVLKDGGVLAVVIQDSTKDFAKSCTTYRLILDYVDKIGFKLFENVIWKKDGRPGAWWNKRFRIDHEYILLFFKGKKPKNFNKEPLKIPSKHSGKTFQATTRKNDGSFTKPNKGFVKDLKCRGTIWEIHTERNKQKLKHPASFPDKLALDLITCFTEENQVVLDPFLGSGTTCYCAKVLNRSFIGFEIDETYYEISKKRLDEI